MLELAVVLMVIGYATFAVGIAGLFISLYKAKKVRSLEAAEKTFVWAIVMAVASFIFGIANAIFTIYR